MTHNTKAFTLVEILIVVIILGILAAIVIPQFAEASNDARESALASNLQTLRSQIELYKIQHRDMLPGYSRAAATGVITFAKANIVTHLTTATDVNSASGGTLGPYLQSFPGNPFSASATVIDSGAGAAPADDTSQWWLQTSGISGGQMTGKITPNDNATHAAL